ncbi:cobW-domain-containing protein [Russula earlei]|uniref:CobW-domain-containing protein n=1 Tax=Russula earlei TaxID=71964 RepID=A0ACC0TW93_9AGAM|nr:cobW-domain-containing protein [Russula earlei]
MPSNSPSTIPITVFTGFLGAGKTSLILSILPQLPTAYRVVLLKNEFGDIEVDSQLAKQSSLTAVSEILNGCMCCVLVGQMKNALLEILEKYHPDRIIIESSGSAFPAHLAFQIRELERETSRALALDSIVTVIDAENFTGYEDTSVTARMQAQYTDVLLINKWEHVSERALDEVLDHLNTLNDHTPKIRCAGKSVDPALIFGIDSKLFRDALPLSECPQPIDAAEGKIDVTTVAQHHDEVETVTLLRGAPGLTPPRTYAHATTTSCDHPHPHPHPHPRPHPESITAHSSPPPPLLDEAMLSTALHQLPKESVYRVKGFVRFATTSTSTPSAGAIATTDFRETLPQQWWILNWAFGRWELVPASDFLECEDERGAVRLTVMGERGEVRRYAKRLAEALGAEVVV